MTLSDWLTRAAVSQPRWPQPDHVRAQRAHQTQRAQVVNRATARRRVLPVR